LAAQRLVHLESDLRLRTSPLFASKNNRHTIALCLILAQGGSVSLANAAPPASGNEGASEVSHEATVEASKEPSTVEAEAASGLRFGKTMSLLTVGAGFLALNTWAYFAWYQKRATVDEIVYANEGYFGPDTYAGGSDKLGHMWVNYTMNRFTSRVLQEGGWSPWVAGGIATATTLGFFTFIEIKDGKHAGYGFSWQDMLFNALGNGLALAFETLPRLDELLDFKVYYFPSPIFLARVKERGAINAGEDYSAQTFTLDLHLGALPGVDKVQDLQFLKFLDLSLGYQSLGYLPEPTEPHARRMQEGSIAISVNVQHLLNLAYGYSSGKRIMSHGILNFGAEVLGVPLTRFPLVEIQHDSGPAN
jgi:hypothetical protein